MKDVGRHILWSLSMAWFIGLATWILYVYPCPEDCPWWVSGADILNLPVASFWYFSSDVLYIDLWFGQIWELSFPAAFYYHMWSSTIAWVVWLLMIRLFWRKFSGHHSLCQKGWYLVLVQWSQRLVLAVSIAASIWVLYVRPLENPIYHLVAEIVRWLNLPIALAGRALPQSWRGLDLWFAPLPGIDEAYARLDAQLVLGTLVYLAILTGLATVINSYWRQPKSAMS